MKQVGYLTLLIAAMLVFAIAFPVAASGPKAATPVVLAAPAPAATPMPPHPRVEHAIEALRSAREHMEHAEGEFHGHRDAAIHHIDEAIKEAEICLREP